MFQISKWENLSPYSNSKGINIAAKGKQNKGKGKDMHTHKPRSYNNTLFYAYSSKTTINTLKSINWVKVW